MGQTGTVQEAAGPRLSTRSLQIEVGVVLLVTFGASALSSILDLADISLADGGVGAQRVTLNAPVLRIAALDIGRDLVYTAHLAAFAGLALVLLARDPIASGRIGALERIGLRWTGSRAAARELGSGVSLGFPAKFFGRTALSRCTATPWGQIFLLGPALAALIGLPGLALYVLAHQLGIAPAVAPASGYPWWRAPELVLLAFANGLAEEVVVVGYLITRLRQLGVAPYAALGASALLRGCYHLYQGPAAGLGNVAMGLVFGLVWLRWRRLAPLIAAHTLIDCVAFVGYPLLHGHVSWLP